MNITDEDHLNAEEYDAKRKEEKQAYLDKQPRYSKRDMLSLANYIGGPGDDAEELLKEWTKWTNRK